MAADEHKPETKPERHTHLSGYINIDGGYRVVMHNDLQNVQI